MTMDSHKTSTIAETKEVRPLNDHEIELVSGAGYDWMAPGQDGPVINYDIIWT